MRTTDTASLAAARRTRSWRPVPSRYGSPASQTRRSIRSRSRRTGGITWCGSSDTTVSSTSSAKPLRVPPEAVYAYVRATVDVAQQHLSIVLDGRVIDQHPFLLR
jgi:hypothetical protein